MENDAMQIHIMYVTESLCGWCRGQPKFYWIALLPEERRILRARGPFMTRAETIRSAANANPTAELIFWNSAQPDLPLWEAGAPIRSKMITEIRFNPLAA